MKKLKYSVIIPIYNKEEYLEDCILSVINQEVKEIEILLINDGSTDRSIEICHKFEKIDSRIIVIDKENSGVSDTRNIGIDVARGKYILFLDADDLWHNKLLSTIDKNIGDSDIFYFRSCRDKNLLRASEKVKVNTISNKADILKSVVYNQHIINECNINFNRVTDYAISTKLLKQSKIDFNTSLKVGEDKLFNFELLQKIDKISFVNDCLYYIRTNDKSVMGSYNENALEINEKMLNAFKDAVDSIKDKELKSSLINLCYCLQYQIVWNTITSDICHKDNRDKYKTRKERYQECKKYLNKKSLLYLNDYDKYLFNVFNYPFIFMDIIMKNRIIRGCWFYCYKILRG